MKRFGILLLALLLMTGAAWAQEQPIVVMGDRQPVELQVGEPFRVKGHYAIEGTGAITFSNDALFEGSTIVYLKTKESGEEPSSWFCPPGTFAPMLVRVSVTNFTAGDMKVLDHVTCQLEYDGKYRFPTTITQINPGQMDGKGQQTEYGSTEPVSLAPVMSTELRILVNVPLLVRDADGPLVAELAFDDDVYRIGLRDALEIQ